MPSPRFSTTAPLLVQLACCAFSGFLFPGCLHTEPSGTTDKTTDTTTADLVAPTALTATGGDRQAQLAWQAADGATSYKLLRSATAGGPYLEVATTNETSLVDRQLAQGT